jgi:hypothetical protein
MEATMNDAVININRHVHELLVKQHSIAAIWCTDDVRGVRPDLTEEQQVLEHHDAEWGINWTTLETTADDLFPSPTSRRRKS